MLWCDGELGTVHMQHSSEQVASVLVEYCCCLYLDGTLALKYRWSFWWNVVMSCTAASKLREGLKLKSPLISFLLLLFCDHRCHPSKHRELWVRKTVRDDLAIVLICLNNVTSILFNNYTLKQSIFKFKQNL